MEFNKMTDAQLIGLYIGEEAAKSMLKEVEHSYELLATKSPEWMCKFEGVTMLRAQRLATAFEVGRRRHYSSPAWKRSINSSREAFEYLRFHFMDKTEECIGALYLNRANKVVKFVILGIGSDVGAVYSTKLMIRKLVELNACNIILAHNHPSGSLRPSEADISLTQKVKEQCKLMDATLLDHVIVHNTSYFSMADEGLMNNL